MNINSLVKKTILVDDDGNNYVDLSRSSIDKNAEVSYKDICKVNADQEMRIDLISIRYYGSTKYIDLICKANNIYNPFSIKEGDILLIPSEQNENEIYTEPVNVEENEIKLQFNDTSKMSVKDKTRLDRLKKKLKNNTGSDEVLPPNIMKKGDKQKTIKGKNIFLGANVNK